MRLRRKLVMAGGDEAEFEAYVTLDGGRLLGFALLLAGDYRDAEDLVQMALLRPGRVLLGGQRARPGQLGTVGAGHRGAWS